MSELSSAGGLPASKVISLLARVEKKLSSATTLEDATDVVDAAELLRQHARIGRLSLDVQNRAAVLRIRAERQAGAILAQLRTRSPDETSAADGRTARPRTLGELGISKSQSSRWQLEASVPDDKFDTFVSNALKRRKELSSAALMRLAKSLRNAATEPRHNVEQPPWQRTLDGLVQRQQKFGCILADLAGSSGSTPKSSSEMYQANSLRLKVMRQLPITELAAAESHLHLWVPEAMLFEASSVFDSWGFRYQGMCVWIQEVARCGEYWQRAHEVCLLGVRGECEFRSEFLSWFDSPDPPESGKPREMRDRIEAVSPGPYLELFGDKSVNDWTVVTSSGECCGKSRPTENCTMSDDGEV